MDIFGIKNLEESIYGDFIGLLSSKMQVFFIMPPIPT
jgi:hypothetical protein